jgi:uncharacterized Zn finger protein (UPF0148 family)
MTETTCNHCEYEWNYTGDMDMTTCPNCQRKTEVGDE